MRLAPVFCLVLVISCGGETPSSPSGDPFRGGDPVVGGDASPSDSAAGDPASGDPLAGDPLAGDPLAGDALAGDPMAGDPMAGDPMAGDPMAGDPMAGDPLAGDPLVGDPHPAGWPTPCDSISECDGTDACVGGGCVPLVDPVDYIDEVQQRPASYWWTLQWPALFDPPERCCFDFNGDSNPDDTLGTLLGLMGTIPGASDDPQATVDLAIDTGELVRIVDWRGLPGGLADGDAWLSVLDGLLNGDGSGGAVDLAGRQAGLSHVLVDPASLGSHGALSQLNDGAVVSTLLDARGGPLRLPLVFVNVPMELELFEVRVRAPLRLNSGGCQGVCTVDEVRANHTPALVAGAQVGGIVLVSQFIDEIDGALRTCACAGVDPDETVISYEVNSNTQSFDIFCCDSASVGSGTCFVENLPDSGTNCADPLCSDAAMMCSILPVFANVADVDADNDDINDAFSAGFRIGLAGTTIDGLAGQSCGATRCDGVELCNVDTCECGAGAACDDAASVCYDRGDGPACRCVDGSAGDAFCGGAPFVCIDGECIDTDTDERYCGASMLPCALGEGCVAGVCVCGADPTDGTGGALCDPSDTCVPLATGAYRCGCAEVLDGTPCSTGTCCVGACVVNETADSCGTCGSACGTAPVQDCNFVACTCSTAGDCVGVRGIDVDCCSPFGCVDRDRDISHCGDCATDCNASAPAGMEPASCDGGVCTYRCQPGFYDCDGAPGCEVDLEMATSGPSCAIARVAEGESIQDAVSLVPGGLVIVEPGTYVEHVAFANTAVVSMAGPWSTVIEGVRTTPASSYPLVQANMEIGYDAELRGFTIRSPAVACDEYASGILVLGPNVVLADNLFEVSTGAVSRAIVTDPSATDVSGLRVIGNRFTHLSPIPDTTACGGAAVVNVYEGILINTQQGALTAPIWIEHNVMDGFLFRGVWSERRWVGVRGNIITTVAADPFVGQGNEGLYPVGVHFMDIIAGAEGNAITNMSRGVGIDADLSASDDVALTNNCIDFNRTAIELTGVANGFTVDATGGYWGAAGVLACPAENCVGADVDTSGALTRCPARVEDALSAL